MPKSVLIAGTAVRLTGATAKDEADLTSALDRATTSHGDPALTLTCAPGTVELPTRKPDRVAQHVSTWLEKDRTVLGVVRGPRAELRADGAVLDPDGQGERGVHALLFPVLSGLLTSTVVHCGGFLHSTGAVLLVGSSGKGKSTAIAAALAAGYDVISDDLVALRQGSTGVEVAGLPLPLALPADLATGAAYDGDERGRVRPHIGPVPTGWQPVTDVVVVSHSREARGALEPAPARDVMLEIINGSLQGLHPTTVQSVFPLGVAASKARGWVLGHAADPAQRLSAAAEKLALVVAEQ